MPVPRNYDRAQPLSARPTKSASQQQQSQRVDKQQAVAPSPPPPPANQKSDQQVEADWLKAKEHFEKAVKEYHDVMLIKKLDTNKSSTDKERERSAIDGLYKAATELDINNLGEGSTALGTVSVTELLFLRSRVNELEYQQLLMLKELRELQKELGVKTNEQK